MGRDTSPFEKWGGEETSKVHSLNLGKADRPPRTFARNLLCKDSSGKQRLRAACHLKRLRVGHTSWFWRYVLQWQVIPILNWA
jgi:hypothetical protein